MMKIHPRWSVFARWGLASFCAVIVGCAPGAVLPDGNGEPEPCPEDLKTTTVILVRHTERDPGEDPPINAEGEVRAQALAEALGENGVDAIYVTNLIRNRQSVEPLATLLGIEPVLIGPIEEGDPGIAEQFINAVMTQHQGQTVLYVGNVGAVIGDDGVNLTDVYVGLGGTGNPPALYAHLYVITLPEEGEPHVVKARYGAASSLDPA